MNDPAFGQHAAFPTPARGSPVVHIPHFRHAMYIYYGPTMSSISVLAATCK